MTEAVELERHLNAELGKVLFGMEDTIHALTISLINRGHVLLEGPPGLGKTRLSKAFAKVVGGTFKRIQGTADLMPTDVTGVHIYNAAQQQFEFQRGPLFADLLLVDEINRAGPKTQSALLEAMEERQVTVDRDTYPLAENFLVVATQNPREFEGTFPLPESQLDRFALNVPVPYPQREDEVAVITAYSGPGGSSDQSPDQAAPLQQVADGILQRARTAVAAVHMSEELVNYVLDLTAASRASASVNLGLSMRGALVLAQCARVEAALRGAEFVLPDDVRRVAPWVIEHRLVLTAEAALDGTTAAQIVDHILQHVAVPK